MYKLASALPGRSTKMDPMSKTIYKKVWIRLANNLYDKLEDNEVTTPTTYKISWLLDTAASGNYGDNKTNVCNRRKIISGTGIRVSCANNSTMNQIEEGILPFDNIPDGAEDVQLFKNMHAPLLSGRKFVMNGCKLVLTDPMHASLMRR